VSITRLQQARQMYALGKLVERVGGIMGSNNGSMLVTPTRDGSRPGYYGPDAGHENDPGHGSNAPGGGNGGNGGNDGPQHSPHTKSGYTGPTNYGPQQPPQEIIGGKKFDVTPDTRDDRERARVKQSILNPTVKRNKIFDPISNSFINPFAPTEKPGFGILDLGLMLATGGLFGTKAKTAAQLFGTAKRTKNLVSDLSNTFGFENPIVNLFSGNKTSTSKSKSTKKII